MTAMSTFQSLTVHCARCHNHKFDPITQEDYYRLQAIFAGIDRGDRPADLTYFKRMDALLARRTDCAAGTQGRSGKRKPRERARRLRPSTRKLDELEPTAPKSPSNGYHSGVEAKPDVTKWVQVDLGESRPIAAVRLIPARPTDFPGHARFRLPGALPCRGLGRPGVRAGGDDCRSRGRGFPQSWR